MRQAARPATTTQPANAPAPIPFRKSGGVSGPEIFGSLVVTLLLLAALAGLAFYARKRGWLDRWLAVPAGQGAVARKLAVLEVLNISRRTSLIRVRHGDRELLIVESSGNIEVRTDPVAGAAP